ncbi:hypothetical protein ACIOYV_18295 [Pseudomonas sp. NPDC087342]|uniref:hypothetical protein n=1 Tax=Pseudomonas sp. NPDC087342 TaxID=3364437 RepID=UPI003805EBE0
MEIKGMPSLINTTPITLTPEQIAAGKAGGEKIKEMIDSGAIDMKNPTGTQLTPGVIYHPSNPSPSQPSDPGTPMVAIDVYVGRTEPTKDFPAAHDRLMAAHEYLKTSYMQFLDDLKNIDPTLEEKDFGFTVDPQGQLKATSPTGSVSAEDLARLTEYMNQSDALKDAANEYASSSFEYVKEDREYLGTGGFILNKDNFEKTIDLGQLFTYQKSGNTKMSNYFFMQVFTKGERATLTA